MNTLLLTFIILKLLKDSFESYLSYKNRKYYLNTQNQEHAKKTLEISDEDFSKILSYTEDKHHFAFYTGWLNTFVLLAFIAFGGFAFLENSARSLVEPYGASELLIGLVFWALFGLINTLYSLPFDLYQTFKIEEKHGFNRQKLGGFFGDQFKGLLLSIILGGAFIYVILSVMDSGSAWWLYAWAFTTFFGVLVSWLYPTLLAPLFNKFSPLPEGELKEEIYSLARKIDFLTDGIFVMDASKRSSHGNAYFTGLFGKKRIVLFDTLIESLKSKEIVAVLAHELGHFKLHHVRVAMIRSVIIMGFLFYILSLCKPLEAFYQAFGFSHSTNYAALLVFGLWYGIVGFVFNPLQAWLSQKNEFAADDFAKQTLNSHEDLCTALVKLQKKNQSMPLTDPTFSSFYYSHPPLLLRIDALKK